MVRIEHISYTYPHAEKPVLKDVSFSLTPGECTAVLGKNGAGKSTLLKCIDRILPAAGSALSIDGENLSAMHRRRFAQHVAYVPQQSVPSSLNVFDTVLLGRRPYIRYDETAEDRAAVEQAIREIGLGGFELRPVSELSGGEVQKVLLARALAQQPKLLLLDEPTSNLDPRNQHEALTLIRRIAGEKQIAVLVVIHDLTLALRYFDRFLFLKEGAVYASGDREIMTPEHIEAVYDMHAEILEHDGIPLIVPRPNPGTGFRNSESLETGFPEINR